MGNIQETVDAFFDRYARALLDRDASALAGLYAVPSLIIFPGQSVPVSEARQTEEFFASAWSQYEGIHELDRQIAIMGQAPGSVWVDVMWSYGDRHRERFCYQLVNGPAGYQIAVLTLMAAD
ncbi:hypothetical protein QFZ79_000987 [Arthrobacter sp. V4I6]|uniref:hypothetical protein n=1 Tax=unclassified Arthrobacter TaxID=235627 RepID=UPI00277E8260|nr:MULTISPECIES: hypothetical protein [unclassified Arthrobacter]MDQ0823245.1 hypothetical protein [Arthrobacter sp. V1I7]MDQ0852876.1 hypothetical protein [Arthrobacter sp. V4I6]